MPLVKVTVALDQLYEARDEGGHAIFVRPVKIGNGRVRCQDVNADRSLVLPPHQIVREVTDREIKEANAARLDQLERDIAAKALGFVALGNDLKEVREQRLYRVRNYSHFDDYCQVRWGMSRRYAEYLIQAAEVYANLANNCSRLPLPTTESQCRELARLDDPRLQVKAWEQAVRRLTGRVPTAEQVRAVIETDFRRPGPDPSTSPGDDPASSPVDAKQKGYRVTERDLSGVPVGSRRGRSTGYPISPLRSTVVCGDCQAELDKLADQSIDLVFTSPPYFNVHPECGTFPGYGAYLDFLRGVVEKLSRVLVEGRFLIVNSSPVIVPRDSRSESSERHAIPFDLHHIIMQHDYEFIEEIVWLKPEGAGWVNRRGCRFAVDRHPLKYKTVPVTEYLMVYRRRSDRLIDWFIRNHPDPFTVEMSKVSGDYEATNVWRINPSDSPVHPATFPVGLAERVVRYYSFRNDVVLDPLAGIGTVGTAALNLGRRFYLIEKSRKFIDHFLRAERERFPRPAPAIRSSAR